MISIKQMNKDIKAGKWLDSNCDLAIVQNLKRILRYNTKADNIPYVRELFCQIKGRLYKGDVNTWFWFILNDIYTYGYIEGKRAARRGKSR